MKIIELSQDKVTIVDDADYRWLKQIKWYAAHVGSRLSDHWYAVTTDSSHHQMHRVIMRCPIDRVVDHIDGDGLNNQKHNLRIVTVAQNAKNRRKGRGANGSATTSRFKGVNWYPSTKTWLARIQVEKQTTFIGYYKSEEDAARAYDEMARKLHGEFASLNFR